VQDVQVEVVHIREKYSVVLTVPSTANIEQVKQILVSDMGEGNVEDIRFFLYSGTTAELMDSEKIGTRRRLHGDGFGCQEAEEESSPDAEEKVLEMPPLSDAKEEPLLLTSADMGLGVDQQVKEATPEVVDQQVKEETPEVVEQAIKLLDEIKQVGAEADFVRKIDALYQRNGITLKLGLVQLTSQIVEKASIHSGVKADVDKLKEIVKDAKDNALIVEKASEIELMLRLKLGSMFGVLPEKHDAVPPTMKSPPMQERSPLTEHHVPHEESAKTTNGANKEIAKEIS